MELGWINTDYKFWEDSKSFLELILGDKAQKNPWEAYQHLPSILEAGSEDVTQSHDIKPQSICSEKVVLCKPPPRKKNKRNEDLLTCAGDSVILKKMFSHQKGQT